MVIKLIRLNTIPGDYLIDRKNEDSQLGSEILVPGSKKTL